MSLRIKGTDITYHSQYGAIAESRHIYINAGLEYIRQQEPHKKEILVLETGFGSGLNALLTADYAAMQQVPVRYITLEPFPLSPDLWQALRYEGPDPELFRLLHEADWEQDIIIHEYFVLHKLRLGIRQLPPDVHAADVVYYDAFAPGDQPELWTPDIFTLLFNRMATGSALTTYCAKGEVRRSMQAAGFRVQRLEGPPGGKREILRALKAPTGPSPE